VTGYVVETPFYDADGKRRGTARLYVLDRERAIAHAAENPLRTWRELTDEQIPEVARERFAAHAKG
jgi:hypothetical protein